MSLPQTFHQFPLLPKELQIQILNHAIYSIPARSIIIIPSTVSPGNVHTIRTSLPTTTVTTTILSPATYPFPGAPPTTTTTTAIPPASHKLMIQPQDAQTSLLALLTLNHLSRTLTLRCYSPAFADFLEGRYVYVRRGDRIAVRGYKDDRRDFFVRGYLACGWGAEEERKERSERCVGIGIGNAGDEGERKFRVEARRNGVVYWNVCWGGHSGV